jgi:hypothetical protein
MQNILYAPWRNDYVTKEHIEGCVFCHISKNKKNDEKLHVLYRDEHCFIVMNRYPYTPGHFMIIPHQHTDALEELPASVWVHISKLAQKGVLMLKDGFGAHGVNLGMNLGEMQVLVLLSIYISIWFQDGGAIQILLQPLETHGSLVAILKRYIKKF